MTKAQPSLLELAGITPLPIPERCPGGYSMHFYCKYENPDHPWQGSGLYVAGPIDVETRGQAIAQMRRNGWIYHRDGTATCPRCAAALAQHRRAS